MSESKIRTAKFAILLMGLMGIPISFINPVLAAQQQILTVKIEGFSDTKLVLITNSNNRIESIKILNDQVSKEFKPEQFKEGYSHRYYGFKAVTVRSPDLNPETGGTINLEYRKKASVFSGMGYVQAKLKKDEKGQWTLETPKSKGKEPKPFRVLELSVKKEIKEDGTYKFLGIEDFIFSGLPDFNRLVAELSPDIRVSERQQFAEIRHPRPGEKAMIMAQDLSASDTVAGSARAF
ncbi:MAG TPA: hypothetical protein DCS07_05375 [Bdellovibrionales bacterium]|nr:MAG: hypothetical protein A2Z97_09060 [Bdellovibrionales bacterium GWB1_52_6]OFZ06304.1 MAG: hypothetical protein A2X97_02460 [Bdellovibrionales bacterium GWA1_52_35]OFZ36145.1 MAG: hypothetical protein A2070_04470 [Bdellovibrionales bacterium GWC1_52_8]HAR42049.1 hypothetical protein [Bdellovibrionales bacterium]HCM40053.1 hypothetical protein [Bdellovibrionales bacterium]